MRAHWITLLALLLSACGSEDRVVGPAPEGGAGSGASGGSGGSAGSGGASGSAGSSGSVGSGGSAGTSGSGGSAGSDGGGAGGATPRGERSLGMHIAEGSGEDYFAAVSAAQALGVTVVDIAMPWGSVQTACSPAAYDPTFVGYLDALTSFKTLGLKVGFVVLGPINTNVKEVPAELAARPLDDPAVVACFNGFVDFVLDKLANVDLHSFAIGNEIDGWLGTDAARWQEYAAFYQATRAHVKSVRPTLAVGTVGTLDGQLGPAKQRFIDLNRDSDLILFTTYALESDFTVKPVSSVDSEWDALVAQYPGKRIHAQEAGHPSATICQSSEAEQAEYMSAVFRAWDRHAAALDTVYIAFLTDWDPTKIGEIASYYGIDDPRFEGYLGSLGLRRWDTTRKLSYARVQAETAARGW